MIVKKGSVDVITYFNLVDSAAGTPETGLTITNIDATYTRAQAAAVKNDLTALAATTTAHTDNKGIEVDATNAPGLYRVDFPDAAFATGADRVILTVTCSGCAPAHLIVELVNYDPTDAVRLGLTSLPNAAADAAGGLPISDAGGLDLDAKIGALTYGTANRVNVQVYGMEAGTVTAAAIANGAIDAATFAADVDAEILSYIVDDATRIDASALNTLSSHDPGEAIMGATDLGTGSGLTSLASAANLATVAGYIDTEIGTIITHLTDIKGATWSAGTDSLEAIRDRGDAAWITATGFSTLDAAGVRTAVGLASANLDTQLGDLPTNAELTTALGTADDATLAAIAALNNISSAGVSSAVTTALTTAIAESYRATGSTGSVAQLLYEILGNLINFANVGTLKTVTKLDKSTTAKTYTYDSATDPITAIEETT